MKFPNGRQRLVVRNHVLELREALNLTRYELATSCGTTPSTIEAIEEETFNCSTMLCLIISAYFKKPVNEIFYLDLVED